MKFSKTLKKRTSKTPLQNITQVPGFIHDNFTGQRVATLVGKWDESLHYIPRDPSLAPKGHDPMSEAVLLWARDRAAAAAPTRYNFSPFAISLNEVSEGLRRRLPPTDSRLRPDQRLLEEGEFETANLEKMRLEQSQRQARGLQEKGWQPRWFRKDREDDCYRYIGGYWETRENGKWDGIPNIFGQIDSSHVVE